MKRRFTVASALLVLGLAAAGYAHQSPGKAGQSLGQTGDEWITLLDGTSLENWEQTGDANWRVVDGVVQVETGNGALVSRSVYGDFEIRVEFKADPASNSSSIIRVADPTVENSSRFTVATKKSAPTTSEFAKRKKRKKRGQSCGVHPCGETEEMGTDVGGRFELTISRGLFCPRKGGG